MIFNYKALPFTEKPEPATTTEQESAGSASSKQLILVRADQLLNITMTKSGLDLVQHLSTLFNDVYNKRLPPSDDDDLPMLSLFNGTGLELSIDKLDGLEVCFSEPLFYFILFFQSLRMIQN